MSQDIPADQATILIEGRSGVPKNPHKAFALARFGAENGCSHCEGVLARCYLGGYGCKEDPVEAEKLATASAAAGSHYVDFVLGYLAYERGNHDLAKMHWQKAADRGLAVAMVNLAKMLIEQSRRMEHDMRQTICMPTRHAFLELVILKKKAFDLLVEACQKGHPMAWHELGTLCDEGLRELAPGCSIMAVKGADVTQNTDCAQEHLRILFEEILETERSMRQKGCMPSERPFMALVMLKKKVFDLLVEACQKGNSSAWRQLGNMCSEGFSELAPGCFILSHMAQSN
jgi:TPR repeat protein